MPTLIPLSRGDAVRFSSYSRVLRLAAALTLLFSTMAASRATEHRIECPLKLQSEFLQVVQPPAGWTAFVPTALWLHSAGPMDGPPAVMAILKENFYAKRGGKITTKWVWASRGETYPDGKWMACNYGDANDVILSKRIDDNTSECTVITTKNEYGRNEVDIHCKW